jgi:hypothetical protein
MKKASLILVVILLVVMAGCGGRSNQSKDTSGTVDVIANYAEKEPTMQDTMDREENPLGTNDTLINQNFVQEIVQEIHDEIINVDVRKTYTSKKKLILQDFMDVEYIALETNDDFVNQGRVKAIGKEVILVANRNNDGDIFIYDRTGKALRKINRRGQGPEEYVNIIGITLDEDNGEIFVNDIATRKIVVYDLYGNFKRGFKHKQDPKDRSSYYDIFNYDRDNLICYDGTNKEIAFFLISKQDGSVTKEIKVPLKERKKLMATKREGGVTYARTPPGQEYPIIPFNGHWVLTENSSDTIFSFLPDYSLRPFIVRTPSVQSMNPEIILLLKLMSDRYYFMETIENEYSFETNTGFTRNFLMYDKQEKTLSGYIVYNGDYSIQKEIYLSFLYPVNRERESWQIIETDQLVESYKKGELKGKLNEIAAKLNEDDNPVIMLIKHR